MKMAALAIPLALVLVAPAGAKAGRPNLQEFQFLQVMHLEGELAGKTFEHFEKSKGANPALTTVCIEQVQLSIKQIEEMDLPAVEVRDFRDRVLDFLRTADEIYRAYRDGEFTRLEKLWKEAKDGYRAIERAWRDLEPRYDPE